MNFEELAQQMVGDGGTPNVFFITNEKGQVVALVTTTRGEAIFTAKGLLANTVEDRQEGVIWSVDEERGRGMHVCAGGTRSDEPTRWALDAQGIELCRVCDECEEEKLAKYLPEILSGYSQEDVDEPIEEDS